MVFNGINIQEALRDLTPEQRAARADLTAEKKAIQVHDDGMEVVVVDRPKRKYTLRNRKQGKAPRARVKKVRKQRVICRHAGCNIGVKYSNSPYCIKHRAEGENAHKRAWETRRARAAELGTSARSYVIPLKGESGAKGEKKVSKDALRQRARRAALRAKLGAAVSPVVKSSVLDLGLLRRTLNTPFTGKELLLGLLAWLESERPTTEEILDLLKNLNPSFGR